MAYTIVYIVLFTLCYFFFLLVYQKSFFRSYDGYDQHYISFLYIGRWGRSIIKNIFVDHKFCIPLWEQAIGYGADIPTSLAAYLWDPFNWISLFIPESLAEYGYAAMIIMKFYACGIAYSIFALHRRQPYYAVLCGSIIYTFSAISYVGFYQSFFINPLIIFPLLIMGVDILFDEKKPAWYVGMLAVSFASYFYFAYMMCILVAAYCIIKLIFAKDMDKKIPNVISLILRFLIYSVISAGISAVSLLPSLIVMLQAGRLSLPHYLPALFNKGYYSGIFVGFTTTYNMLGRDCNIGFGVIALICVIVLFTYQKNYWQIKTEFILMTVGLCIPYVGHIMNGFSYTANRWVWAYALVVGYIVTLMVPKLKELSMIQKIVLTLSAVLYIVISHAYFKISGERFDTAAILIMLITMLCFVFSQITERQFKIIVSLLSCICVVCLSFFVYSRDYGNSFAEHTDAGTAYESMKYSGGLPLLNIIDTSDGSRFDRYGIGQTRNATWLYGVSGIDFYISVYNDNIDKFHNSVAMNTGSPACYSYSGLNRRSELEALLGVNHYFVNADNVSKPFGYNQLEAEGTINGMRIQSYQPDAGNALFYTFNQTVSYDEYNTMEPYERQQILAQACVIDKKLANTSISDLNIQSESIPFQMNLMEGISINGNTIHAEKAGGQIELLFDNQKTSELYVYLENLEFEDGGKGDYSISVQGFHDEQPIANLSDGCMGYTYYNHMYGAKLNWLLNLGMTDDAANRIVITLKDAGMYTLNNIKLYARDMNDIVANISNLNRNVKNINISHNRISCDVAVDSEKMLFSSVPYSKGWTAYDNGKKVPVEKADVAFMALNLSEGTHHIEFVYRTPGLVAGLMLTIVSAMFFLLIMNTKESGRKIP